jgi:hypothetical protein
MTPSALHVQEENTALSGVEATAERQQLQDDIAATTQRLTFSKSMLTAQQADTELHGQQRVSQELRTAQTARSAVQLKLKDSESARAQLLTRALAAEAALVAARAAASMQLQAKRSSDAAAATGSQRTLVLTPNGGVSQRAYFDLEQQLVEKDRALQQRERVVRLTTCMLSLVYMPVWAERYPVWLLYV